MIQKSFTPGASTSLSKPDVPVRDQTTFNRANGSGVLKMLPATKRSGFAFLGPRVLSVTAEQLRCGLPLSPSSDYGQSLLKTKNQGAFSVTERTAHTVDPKAAIVSRHEIC